MATLKLATKANQASTLPALLVATFAKESESNASITVNFEDVDFLKSDNSASVELSRENLPSVYSSEKVISELLSIYPFLQGNTTKLVRVYDH